MKFSLKPSRVKLYVNSIDIAELNRWLKVAVAKYCRLFQLVLPNEIACREARCHIRIVVQLDRQRLGTNLCAGPFLRLVNQRVTGLGRS